MSTSEVAGRSRRHYPWALLATLLTVGAMAGAVFGAGLVARNDAEKSRHAFERSSGEVASTLQLAIHDEESLAVNASAFVLATPNASNARFTQWLRSVQAFERYPELKNLGEMVIVPASELPAFAARAVADPSGPVGPDGGFQVIPPGNRPSYCLAALGRARDAATFLPPAGFDFCADPALNKVLTAARDTGKSSYVPVPVSKAKMGLGVQVPIYRGGVAPTTVEARRDAFVGWFGMLLDSTLVLDRALQGHPGTAVTMSHVSGGLQAAFSSGKAPAGAQSVTLDLRNGWTVKTSGAVAGGGILENGNALALLIVGLVLSLLVGVLVFVLSTGRVRALRVAQERTAQLRGAQAQLVDAARQAGMAEIASNVLHNVGNVLNSVNVSANLVSEKVRGSKSTGLSKAVALMHEHAADLAEFLTTDARGKALPGYLDTLAGTLARERESIDEELQRLTAGVAHIKEIVAAQQSLAGVSGVIEPLNLNDLMDDALRMAGVLADDEVTVVRDLPDAGLLSVDRHRVLLVLLNLLSNAKYAMQENVDRPRQLSLRAEVTDRQVVKITVGDNGEGIAPENLTRIFVHGFTTHADGHGFGLHSSALAAKEMGGGLSVHSDGAGTGAIFTLDVPLESHAVAA